MSATRLCVERYLAPLISQPPLSELKMEVRYVPIVMLKNDLQHYPERSKARIKQQVYVSAPQLNYDIFVGGAWPEQLTEYVRGIALSLPHLHKFGATKEQVETFEAILKAAPDAILKIHTDPFTVTYDNGKRAMDPPDPYMNRPSLELLKKLGFES